MKYICIALTNANEIAMQSIFYGNTTKITIKKFKHYYKLTTNSNINCSVIDGLVRGTVINSK